MVDGFFVLIPLNMLLMNVAWRNDISGKHGLDLVLRMGNT